MAAVDTGVPFGAFAPVTITDPGSEGGPTPLTVFAQNPATFGQDRYLLSNPAGLRDLVEGIVIEMSRTWRALAFHGSLITEESLGPTNPGDSEFENDPGVIGSLFMDPNSLVHAYGRPFVDRAWEAKIQVSYRLPRSWGGFELANTVGYIDGWPFGRGLLVTGLPQGPLLVEAERRGASPEGGYRSDYVADWNLRLSRDFRLPVGMLTGNVDVLNVLDANSNLQENDITSSTFFARLPTATQPPRNVRFGIRYAF
jgi:hypothetical protein